MDKFVKAFIAMSVVYLGLAAVLGVAMFVYPEAMGTLKFVHSHLMLLGWVSMMIYGVGYHILPKFAGRFLKHPKMATVQFWAANLGLVGMVVLYPLFMSSATPERFQSPLAVAGALEALSIFLFFYNIMVTMFGPPPAPKPSA
jgi:cbb3-type cytochrome oxidase subunit 1